MCATPTSLIVQHKGGGVYWVDFTGAQPRFTGKNISPPERLYDMCYMPDETKPLIVFSGFKYNNNSVAFTDAYNAGSGELVWSTDMIGGTSTTNGQNMWVTNSKPNERNSCYYTSSNVQLPKELVQHDSRGFS